MWNLLNILKGKQLSDFILIRYSLIKLSSISSKSRVLKFLWSIEKFPEREYNWKVWKKVTHLKAFDKLKVLMLQTHNDHPNCTISIVTFLFFSFPVAFWYEVVIFYHLNKLISIQVLKQIWTKNHAYNIIMKHFPTDLVYRISIAGGKKVFFFHICIHL